MTPSQTYQHTRRGPAAQNVSPAPAADLHSALAEMDRRLHLLRRELDSVALAVARRPFDAAVDQALGRDPDASEAEVRAAILAAEQEARQVVEGARRRIAEITARTRPRTADPLITPKQVQAPEPRLSPDAAGEYVGTVRVEVGSFGDIVQLSEFQHALAAVPGVDDVCIHSFARRRALFELQIGKPTRLLGELAARAPDALYMVAARDRELRLEIFRDD